LGKFDFFGFFRVKIFSVKKVYLKVLNNISVKNSVQIFRSIFNKNICVIKY